MSVAAAFRSGCNAPLHPPRGARCASSPIDDSARGSVSGGRGATMPRRARAASRTATRVILRHTCTTTASRSIHASHTPATPPQRVPDGSTRGLVKAMSCTRSRPRTATSRTNAMASSRPCESGVKAASRAARRGRSTSESGPFPEGAETRRETRPPQGTVPSNLMLSSTRRPSIRTAPVSLPLVRHAHRHPGAGSDGSAPRVRAFIDHRGEETASRRSSPKRHVQNHPVRRGGSRRKIRDAQHRQAPTTLDHIALGSRVDATTALPARSRPPPRSTHRCP